MIHLRPEGMVWPRQDNGLVSFRLERLTEANGIAHEGAHDALSDVRATIALARLVREEQPKLYRYALTLRDKREVEKLLQLHQPRPALQPQNQSADRRAQEGRCLRPPSRRRRHRRPRRPRGRGSAKGAPS